MRKPGADEAVRSLRNQASLDSMRGWFPGQPHTQAQLVISYIDELHQRLADQEQRLLHLTYTDDK